MKIHCDNCDRFLGTYLFGKGGVEERANIIVHYVVVPAYDKYGRKIGTKEIPGISFPDVRCFECSEKLRNFEANYRTYKI